MATRRAIHHVQIMNLIVLNNFITKQNMIPL